MRFKFIQLINATKNNIRKEKGKEKELKKKEIKIKMKVKIDCECVTNGGNCTASTINRSEKCNKCVFQKNHMNEKIMKGRYICSLSNKCRKRLASYGKPPEYFFEHICPQVDQKFEKYLKRKKKSKKKKKEMIKA